MAFHRDRHRGLRAEFAPVHPFKIDPRDVDVQALYLPLGVSTRLDGAARPQRTSEAMVLEQCVVG